MKDNRSLLKLWSFFQIFLQVLFAFGQFWVFFDRRKEKDRAESSYSFFFPTPMARSFFVLTKSWLRNQGFQNVVCFSSRERLPQEQNCLPFVPPCNDVTTDDMHKLQNFVDANEKILVLTGAGISTESGIPDYRSEGVGLYATSTNRPVQYTDFLKSADIRQRYWARNYVGWPRFSSFFPNTGHKVLSEWEKHGKIHWYVKIST